VSDTESVHSHDQGIVEHKVRRAVGMSALRKINALIVEEQQTDNEKANALHWFARYGWIVLPGVASLVAYAMGVI
jgi:hypothetical protein